MGCSSSQVIGYKEVYLFESETDTLTFQDILSNGPKISFIEQKKIKSHGLTDVVLWYKMVLADSLTSQIHLFIDFALLDNVELYWIDQDGTVRHQSSGLHQVNDGERGPVFFLRKGPLDRTVYLKIKSQSPVHIPVFLQPVSDFERQELNSHLLFGILAGCLLIVLTYNLILFFTLKEKVYLLYVFYLVSIGGTFLHYFGYAYKYLWDYHRWNNKLLPLFIFLTAVSLLSFIRHFLNTKTYYPRIDKFILLLILVYVSAIVLLPWLPLSTLYMIGAPGSSLMTVLIFAILIRSYKDRYTPSGYALIGWLFLFSGVITLVGKTFGVFPHTTFTSHYIFFGVVVEVVLFNFGLAARLKFLKKKNEEINRTLKSKYEELELLREKVASYLLNTSNSGSSILISKEEINTYLLNELTERELEVLFFVSEGMSNKDIGERLFISTNTVRAHMRKIYEKLYVKNRTEAVYKANQLQLIRK